VPLAFAVTWDYRCPFARNAHEHVLDGLAAGADWDVTFLPFSLGQVHVEDGEPDVWDSPDADSGLLGLQVGVAVRDTLPDRFHEAHRALFTHRHEQAGSLRDEQALRNVLKALEIDADAVFAEVASGRPLATIKAEHTAYAASHDVWGVPTFIVGDQAAFVRFMHRPAGDGKVARSTIERTVDLLGWPDLNEFKHTSIPH
jgi:hypothetical protein